VSNFVIQALEGKRITIYGDGLQVRDVLHVHDLIDAMVKVREQSATTKGQVFNVGGGPQRSHSVMEMLHAIEQVTGKTVRLEHREVRPGDQPLYISDTSKLELLTGWKPRRELTTILSDIREFWREEREHADSRQLVGARNSALGEVA